VTFWCAWLGLQAVDRRGVRAGVAGGALRHPGAGRLHGPRCKGTPATWPFSSCTHAHTLCFSPPRCAPCPCPIGHASLTFFFFCILQRPTMHMHGISCDMSLRTPFFFLPAMCESFCEKKIRQVHTGGAERLRVWDESETISQFREEIPSSTHHTSPWRSASVAVAGRRVKKKSSGLWTVESYRTGGPFPFGLARLRTRRRRTSLPCRRTGSV
jgi:hypothetical protein